MIIIREMHADDVSDVMRIERASFNEPWAEVHFYFELYTKTANNWVAIENNELCGYLCFWLIANEIHINNIAVKASKKRQGVAQEMMKKLTSFAHNNNVCTMTLEVNEHNEPAKGFYRKNGFEQVGIRPKYYQHDQADALILTKQLETK
jgi:[ribosomal protein S18]-alanine N-acetyltransferase